MQYGSMLLDIKSGKLYFDARRRRSARKSVPVVCSASHLNLDQASPFHLLLFTLDRVRPVCLPYLLRVLRAKEEIFLRSSPSPSVRLGNSFVRRTTSRC